MTARIGYLSALAAPADGGPGALRPPRRVFAPIGLPDWELSFPEPATAQRDADAPRRAAAGQADQEPFPREPAEHDGDFPPAMAQGLEPVPGAAPRLGPEPAPPALGPEPAPAARPPGQFARRGEPAGRQQAPSDPPGPGPGAMQALSEPPPQAPPGGGSLSPALAGRAVGATEQPADDAGKGTTGGSASAGRARTSPLGAEPGGRTAAAMPGGARAAPDRPAYLPPERGYPAEEDRGPLVPAGDGARGQPSAVAGTLSTRERRGGYDAGVRPPVPPAATRAAIETPAAARRPADRPAQPPRGRELEPPRDSAGMPLLPAAAAPARFPTAVRIPDQPATMPSLSIGTIEVTVLAPPPDPPSAMPARREPRQPPERLSRGLGPRFGQGQT